ncbi:cytochrome P450 9e2-like [Megalopta genalis]|uniref:cytochrome P450 9e2-like n=1 Tax=Megalopta genalis TaxID=115081 RepID=UPI003FD63ED5
MESSTLALLLGALVLIVIYFVKTYTFWQRRKIPIPDGYWPLLGHMWPVYTVTKNITDHFEDLYKKCNKHSMYGLYDGLTPALVVREPHLIKTVMQSSFANFQKNGFEVSPKKDPLLATNPFFSVGEAWQNGRKRLTQAFSAARLKNLFTAVTQVCNKQQKFLEKQLKSEDQYEVELKHFFGRFTAESVANAGLGVEGFSYEDHPPPTSFHSIGQSIFNPNVLSAMLFNIVFLKPSIAIFLGIPLLDKRVDAFFRRVVHENLSFRRQDQSPKYDFFQLMIEQETSEGEMNEERISANTLTLFFDGFETSRLTLALVGYHLAKYPEVQEKLRDEIRATIAKNDGELTFDALKELKYMDQVISESQRRHSALVFLKKVCTNECELTGSDGLSIRMKPGMEVYIPINPIHHDAEYWSNPEVFDPDRFSEERKQDIEKMTFLPFGEGPRMCIGLKIAMLMMKSCLATFLNNYKIEMSPKTSVPLKWSKYHFLTEAITGIWVKVSKV